MHDDSFFISSIKHGAYITGRSEYRLCCNRLERFITKYHLVCDCICKLRTIGSSLRITMYRQGLDVLKRYRNYAYD